MTTNLNRRRFIGLLAGGAALSVAGWSSAKPLLVNQCRVAIPSALIDSPWLQQAWAGIDPAQLWDCHVHLAGIGDGGGAHAARTIVAERQRHVLSHVAPIGWRTKPGQPAECRAEPMQPSQRPKAEETKK